MVEWPCCKVLFFIPPGFWVVTVMSHAHIFMSVLMTKSEGCICYVWTPNVCTQVWKSFSINDADPYCCSKLEQDILHIGSSFSEFEAIHTETLRTVLEIALLAASHIWFESPSVCNIKTYLGYVMHYFYLSTWWHTNVDFISYFSSLIPYLFALKIRICSH